MPDRNEPESLVRLLGGRRAGLDAAGPAVVFVAAWHLAGHSVVVGSVVAVAAAVVVGVYRLIRGERPRAVVLGLFGVALAAFVAVRTGRPEDFFLVRLVTNAASALAWVTSIVVQWPLLGLVVGSLLGQRGRWRRDPDLRRAYAMASWVWVAQYVTRVVVFGTLWAVGAVAALGIASVVLTWPLVAVCLAGSAWALRHFLPDDHPGLRQPRLPRNPPPPNRSAGEPADR